MSGEQLTCQFCSSDFVGIMMVCKLCVSLLYDSHVQKLSFCVSRVILGQSGILNNRKTVFFPCLNQGHFKNPNTYF